MDRILAAQHMTADDLLPVIRHRGDGVADTESSSVPIVSHAGALFDPYIRPSAVQSLLQLPSVILQSFQPRASNPRRAWQRFVAVRVPSAESLPMDPLLMSDSIVLIDRHYISLQPNRSNRPNVYAVRHGAHLTFRYIDQQLNRLVLRPHNLAFPIELIAIAPGESLGDLLVGRVALILNEL